MTITHQLINSMTLFLLIMLLIHIIQHTSVSSNSKTLIDSILSNILSLDSVLGNLTNKISDHLIATN